MAIDDVMMGRNNSFNVIHKASVIKADIYPIKQSNAFDLSAMSRRKQVHPFSTNKTIYIASAEDVILQKLRWYKLTKNQSEKQWRDILGVLKARRDEIDYGYVKHWGDRLKVSGELDRAIDQVTLPEQ